MKQMHFEIEVNASKETVWKTLWQDETLRQWAGLIDPETYMIGELQEGQEVQFISAEGYGVISLVAKLVPYEYVLFRHKADTKDEGEHTREDQWTGGDESYLLTSKDADSTVLALTFDVPVELEEIMNASYPQALAKIKELSEQSASDE